jgi:hypothetical protein
MGSTVFHFILVLSKLKLYIVTKEALGSIVSIDTIILVNIGPTLTRSGHPMKYGHATFPSQAFAAANDVQLLMHSDHKEMLPPADLQAVLCTNSHDKDGEGWVPTWVVRHSSLIKGRGVIKSKGYVLKAKRTIEFH